MLEKRKVPSPEDNQYFSVTGSLVNRDDPRYVRILWVCDNPNWKRVSPAQTIVYGLVVNYQDKPALMLETSTICLS